MDISANIDVLAIGNRNVNHGVLFLQYFEDLIMNVRCILGQYIYHKYLLKNLKGVLSMQSFLGPKRIRLSATLARFICLRRLENSN